MSSKRHSNVQQANSSAKRRTLPRNLVSSGDITVEDYDTERSMVFNSGGTGLIDMSKVQQTPNKTELKSTRLYSAKSSNSTFGLYPNKGNDDLCHDLLDLRKESAQTLDNLYNQKIKMLSLISKTIRNLDPSFNKNYNMDLDLTQLDSAR